MTTTNQDNFVHRCSCGQMYNIDTWCACKLLGPMQGVPETGVLELRLCSMCESSMAEPKVDIDAAIKAQFDVDMARGGHIELQHGEIVRAIVEHLDYLTRGYEQACRTHSADGSEYFGPALAQCKDELKKTLTEWGYL